MDITVTLDGVEKTITLVPNGDGYRVVVEGREYAVSDVNRANGMLAFLIDRESYIAHVSSDRGVARMSMRGRNYRMVEETMDVDRPGAGAAHGDGTVEAPMPGNIVAVRVAAGDTVTAGDTVVVVESMKMQNEIAAPVGGVVRRVTCAAGDQVGYGQVLVEIAAPRGDE